MGNECFIGLENSQLKFYTLSTVKILNMLFFLQYLSGNYINIGLSLEILEREFSLESYFSLGALVFSSLPLVSSPSPVWTRGMPLFLPPGEWVSLPTSG